MTWPESKMKKRDQRFMDIACLVATWSKDRSTGVGCVLVRDRAILTTGFNGFPRGINDDVDARHERPAKYLWTEHAERNAVYGAASCGISTKGATAYVNWFPCMDCARALIQAGVVRLVARSPDFDDPKWGAQFRVVVGMLEEARVDVTWLAGPAGIRVDVGTS